VPVKHEVSDSIQSVKMSRQIISINQKQNKEKQKYLNNIFQNQRNQKKKNYFGCSKYQVMANKYNQSAEKNKSHIRIVSNLY
jgi:uncharacterized protein YueI